MPGRSGSPHVIANFAVTLDGVAALEPRGRSSGGDITGFAPRDRMVMGLLRATADAVIVGAGTLRAVPRHVWSAEHASPQLAADFRSYRTRLGKPPAPLNVIVTGSGRLDLGLPVFQSGEVPVLVVTTPNGAQRLRGRGIPTGTKVVGVRADGQRLTARSILGAIKRTMPAPLVLVEGGPHLLAGFVAERALDELFVTIAPQLAGRDRAHPRWSLVEGAAFAPDDPRWGSVVDIREGGGLLFLRVAFPRPPARLPAPP